MPILRFGPSLVVHHAPWQLPILRILVVHSCKNASTEDRRSGIHFFPHALEHTSPIVTDTGISDVLSHAFRVYMVVFGEENRSVPFGVASQIQQWIMDRV